MKKIIITALAVLMLSGCVVFESVSYRDTERVPVVPPVAATENPDTDKWYESLAQGAGDFVSFNWIVGIVGKIKELGETIVYGVRDVKTQTTLKEKKAKYFVLFGSGKAKIKAGDNGVEKE